jgi:hypothetical protein
MGRQAQAFSFSMGMLLTCARPGFALQHAQLLENETAKRVTILFGGETRHHIILVEK